jgi:hypothetical protein
VSFAGNLRTMAFSDLVQWLSSSAKTGTLVIEGPKYTKRLYFRQGEVAAIESDNPREMLGYYLVGWGFVSEQQLQQAIRDQDAEGLMLGELIVQRGYMTAEGMEYLIRIQAEESVYGLMLWEEGEFRFLDDELPDREFLQVDMPMQHLIFEGTRQRDERRRAGRLVPSNQHIPVLCEGARLTARNVEEADLAAAIDGRRSIEEIALACRLPEFVALSYVYEGVRAAALELRPPTDSDRMIPGQSPTPWNEDLAEIRDRLRRDRLLEATTLIAQLRERYPGVEEVVEQAAGFEEEIEQKIAAGPLSLHASLEPAIELSELMQLECDPAEGFVLSRINGVYTVDEVLRQLPGSPLHNRVILHNLLRRNLIKVREVSGIRPYRAPSV